MRKLHLKWRISLVYVLAVVLAMFLSPATTFASAGGVTQLVNAQRSAAGLAPLAYNAQLGASAQAKAAHMLALGYWAHTAPDGTGAWTFISQAGYNYVSAGENLARDFSSDSSIVAAWMQSSGHRANILNGVFTEIGVGSAAGSMNGIPTTIVVAHFGARAGYQAPKPAPALTQPSQTTTKSAPSTAVASKTQSTQPVAATATTPVAPAPTPAPEKPAESSNKKLMKRIFTDQEHFHSPVFEFIEEYH